MAIQFFYTTLPAFALTVIAIYLLTPIATRAGLVDKPCARKRHSGEIPLTGGIAIFAGIICTAMLTSHISTTDKGLFAAAVLLLILGIVDDYRNIPAKFRLIFQSAAGLIIVFASHITLYDFGNLLSLGDISLGVMAIPATVFCIVGVINAMNMIDGIDGLAGGLSIVSLAALSYLSICAGAAHSQLLLATLGAVCGFLVLNARSPIRAKAKIFMGDSGSMVLGCFIAAMLIEMSQGPSRSIRPVTALWIFAIPLMDTTSLIIRRKLKGTSPLSPGRDHIHHILLRCGFNVQQSVTILVFTSALIAAIGVAGETFNIPDWAMFIGFATLYTGYMWFVMRGWKPLIVNRRRSKRQEIPNQFIATINLSYIDSIHNSKHEAKTLPPVEAAIPKESTRKVPACRARTFWSLIRVEPWALAIKGVSFSTRSSARSLALAPA